MKGYQKIASLPSVEMQSRTMSFVEALTNVVVGFGLAVLTQVLVFPAFEITVTFDQHVSIAVIFTLVSLARGYLLRRLFEQFGRYQGPSVNVR